MKRALLILSAITLCTMLRAQTHALFSKMLQADSSLFLSSTPAELPDGDILAVGYVIDSGITKAIMVRADEHGNLLWAKQYSGGVYDRFLALSQSQDSAIYAIGDTKSYGPGGDEMLITKIDYNGNVLWSRIFGGSTGNDNPRSIVTASNGDVLISGMLFGLGAGSTNICYLRLDPQGNLVARKFFGTSLADYSYNIKELAPNRIMLAGSIFNSGTNMDFLVMNLDAAGNLLWAKSYDNALATDEWERHLGGHYQASNGDNYFEIRCGGFGGSGWFDSLDIALVRIDSSGNLGFLTRYVLPGQEWNGSLLPTPDGFVMMMPSNTFHPTVHNLLVWTDSTGVPTKTYVENNDFKGVSSAAIPSARGGYITLGGGDTETWLNHIDADLQSCLPLGDTVVIPYVNQPMNTFTPTFILADTGTIQSITFTEVASLQVFDTMFCYSCEPPFLSFTQLTVGDTISFQCSIQGDYDNISWDFGDGGTSTDLNPTHVFPGPGVYLVCAFATNYCGTDSSCNTVEILVSNGESAQSQVKVYPNPSSGVFNVILPSGMQEEDIFVMDAFGKVIAKRKIQQGSSLELSHLAAGNYWIQFKSLGRAIPVHLTK